LLAASTKDTITVDVDPPADQRLKQLRVALRHSRRRQPREVTVNGARVEVDGETLTLPAPSGCLRIVAKYGL
jgi:hypothetical protein